MKSIFESLAPFIQEYIYRNGWTEIRPIQVAACDLVFNTKSNILLASGTASGKTEAAFLPVLTDIYNNPSKSISVLYISPLKALINDQFIRIEDMLKETEIKVHKWHGDVAQNAKNKALKNPSGIMQTTPESLEAMLMRNPGNVLNLFSDLRYIIIDEVHYFMNDDRGLQLLCILERIQRIIQKEPRRIGLSATLGDYEIAKNWLSQGTKRKCEMPDIPEEKRKIRLGVKYYQIKEEENQKEIIEELELQDEQESFEEQELLDKREIFYEQEELKENEKSNRQEARHNKEKSNETEEFKEKSVSILDYYKDLYEQTLNRKCIIFSNSKSEVESNIAHLKRIAKIRHTKDVYFVHHASISTTLRKQAEETMKQEDELAVTGATLTLELGIDLGRLDRIVQTGSPFTVSSFVQRLGRSGRRGQPSEMLFFFKEEVEDRPKEFYEKIDFAFLKCIAIIELYLKEKWIETLEKNSCPYSLLYHQTMSYLFGMGAVSPKELAKYILTLSPFKAIEKEDYKKLLRYLLEKQEIEKDEEGNLLIGMQGERKVNNFQFFSVFSTPVEYSVRSGAQQIGTVQTPYIVGQQFGLAGFTWKVLDINEEKRQIYVKKVGGISKIGWNDEGDFFTHTKILKKIKEILSEEEEYRYLDKNSLQRLKEIREIAKKAELTEKRVIQLAKNVYLIFPWLGTKQMLALSFCLDEEGIKNQIYYRTGMPLFIQIKTDLEQSKIEEILDEILRKPIDKTKFEIPDMLQKSGKYNFMIPKELLKKQFIEDCVDVEGMKKEL